MITKIDSREYDKLKSDIYFSGAEIFMLSKIADFFKLNPSSSQAARFFSITNDNLKGIIISKSISGHRLIVDTVDGEEFYLIDSFDNVRNFLDDQLIRYNISMKRDNVLNQLGI